ncbi:MAG: sigma-70 family RNA polymerase sigma factor [Chloroflexi bacterium]|nr:sigma-70 family RNA polymerase sigma factor [Chloroflexota bacterium]
MKHTTEELMKQIEPIIKKYAWMAERRGLEYDDAYQEGAVIALEAMDAYDSEHLGRATLDTFIEGRIRHELLNRVVNESMRTIRLPRWLHEDVITPIEHAAERLTQKYERDPTAEELLVDEQLARELQRKAEVRWAGSFSKPELTPEKMDQFIDIALGYGRNTILSMDETTEFGSLADLVEDQSDEVNPEIQTDSALLQEAIEDVLEILPDAERLVMRLRFGFDGPEQTVPEAGRRLNLTAEGVRKIEKRARKILRSDPRSRVMLRNWS